MKLLNYDKRTLILQNVKPKPKQTPPTFSMAQYQILCRLIRRKGIAKDSFQLILSALYGLDDWKNLNYEQMYELIHVLTHWDYEKVRL